MSVDKLPKIIGNYSGKLEDNVLKHASISKNSEGSTFLNFTSDDGLIDYNYTDFDSDGKFDRCIEHHFSEEGLCLRNVTDNDLDGNADEILEFIYNDKNELIMYLYDNDADGVIDEYEPYIPKFEK